MSSVVNVNQYVLNATKSLRSARQRYVSLWITCGCQTALEAISGVEKVNCRKVGPYWWKRVEKGMEKSWYGIDCGTRKGSTGRRMFTILRIFQSVSNKIKVDRNIQLPVSKTTNVIARRTTTAQHKTLQMYVGCVQMIAKEKPRPAFCFGVDCRRSLGGTQDQSACSPARNIARQYSVPCCHQLSVLSNTYTVTLRCLYTVLEYIYLHRIYTYTRSL